MNVNTIVPYLVFGILALVSIATAAAMLISRDAIYSALFLVLNFATVGVLYLTLGAPFIALSQIAVYAGAILVTFLFVLMLAQPQGYAYYDRISWEATFSAIAGAGMVLILTTAVSSALSATPASEGRVSGDSVADVGDSHTPGHATAITPLVDPVPPHARAADILSDQHMEHLGAQLFSRHLIAVEVAGTMLLAALVGAVAIAVQHRQIASPRDASPQGPSLQGGSRHG